MKKVGKLFLVAALVILIFGLIGYIGTEHGSSPVPETGSTPAATKPQAHGVTMAQYEQIETGMTYDQVQSILGAPGKEISRSDIAGYGTVMYSWQNRNGSNMNAMFQNGGLVSKAQFGLP